MAENILKLFLKKLIVGKVYKTKFFKENYFENFDEIIFQGVMYNPLKKEWKMVTSFSVNYMFSSTLK